MTKIKVADFYYGAVLSMLFNNNYKPALIEGDDDRQVYDLTTDSGYMRLFIKYRANREPRKSKDYNSWSFVLTDNDREEMLNFIDEGYNLILALVCGVHGLAGSEIAFLKKEEIKEIILNDRKNSITISRKKHERAFRIFRGGGRENSLQIKTNRFEELFKRHTMIRV